uniref:Syntrophin, gamma 2 n=1 Tax=Scleropages formosus TaxID=113540 RepID=A0A8C9S3L8_SCLFO
SGTHGPPFSLLYSEETSNTYDIRLKLTKEVLIIQKQDVICISGGESHSDVRMLCSVSQGGAEHKVPVVISKIFKDQVGKLMMLFMCFVTQFNISLTGATDTGLVHLLRNAGDEVTITVQYLREAPSFLKLPLGSPEPCSDHSSRASSPLFDSGCHLNGNSNHTVPSSPLSPSANEPKYEKRWVDTLSLPLLMARVSRYRAGTHKLRPNCFEVIALDGECSSILQFSTASESTDWLQSISTNINNLTLENMKVINKCFAPEDQIIHMGWVCENLQASDSSPLYNFKFLALKGSSLFIFRRPPVSTLDWERPEAIHNLCEVLFKTHKLCIAEDCWIQMKAHQGLQRDCEPKESRPFSFSVLVGHGQSHSFSVELGSDLVTWEKAFQRAVFMEVQRVGSKTYMCSSQGKILCFTIDFGSGFTCSESNTKNILWRYKFSQLKGSSDDGKTRVKLLFQNSENKQIEMKELEFANLTAVLHCVHSFIAAKVASVDPVFISSHSIARKHTYN